MPFPIPRRLIAAVAAIALLVSLLQTSPASAASVTFSYTGGIQQFTVPAGVTSISVSVQGAGGEAITGTAGAGAQVDATLTVAPGDVLQLMVGGAGSSGVGGFNGGGDGGVGFSIGGSGGGASDIRTGPCAASNACGLGDRVVVAGGGGGTGSDVVGPAFGGDGGDPIGLDGNDPSSLAIQGFGATTAAGGAGGGNGTGGTLGQGGTGGDGVDAMGGDEGGAGGGGGFYGGGGGGGGDFGTSDPSAGNAGGGSSMGPGGSTFTAGVNAGHGSITITYTGLPPAAPTTTSIVSSSTPTPSAFAEPVSFTASVTPIPAGGTVQFQVDGFDVGGPVAVDGAGEATSDPFDSLAVGAHSIAAIYSGDVSFDPSTSSGFAHSVGPASTTLTLVSSPATGTEGAPITYTASVTVDAPSTALANGIVDFTDDGAPIAGCTAVVLDGSQQAECATTAGMSGTHTIVATYAGTVSLASSFDQAGVIVDPAPPVTTTTTTAPTTTVAPTPTAPTTTSAPTTTPVTTTPVTTTPVTRATTTTGAPTTTRPTTTPSSTTPPTTKALSTSSTSAPSTTEIPEVAIATTTTVASVAMANVVFNVAIEAKIEGTTADVDGEGFLPGTMVSIVMFSDPIELGTATVASDGTFEKLVRFPAGVEPGSHRVEVSGQSAADAPVTYTWYLQLDERLAVTQIERDPLPVPPEWYVPNQLALELPYDELIPEYIVTEHAPAVVATMVSGFALLTVLGGSGGAIGVGGVGGFAGGPNGTGGGLGGTGVGLAGAGLAGARTRDPEADGEEGDDKKKQKKLGGAAAKHHLLALENSAIGDRSLTWQFRFCGSTIDRWSAAFPPRVAAKSPLLARIVTDGIQARAMFGPLSMLAPLLGIFLGVQASLDVGGAPIPPGLFLVIAIVLLSIYDSLAGVCAAAAFTLLTLVGGDVTSLDALRGLLGINLVFFTAPLIASKARPLRREPSRNRAEHFDRLADAVIASLIGAWAVEKLVGALPGLAGLDFPIVDSSRTIAGVVLVALLVRYALETAVMWWYPSRLSTVSPAKLAKPGDRQKLMVLAFQTGMFVFMAYPFLGNVWELWVGTALFAVPQLIGLREDNLPNLPWLVRWIPGGIVKTTVMIVIGTYFTALVKTQIDDPARFITLGFVVLGFPGLLLTTFGFFGRDGKKWELNWPSRLGGIGVLAIGIMLVEGVITLG